MKPTKPETEYRKITPEELMQWASPETSAFSVDIVMEFLHDQGCLNERGEKLNKAFWKKYIKV